MGPQRREIARDTQRSVDAGAKEITEIQGPFGREKSHPGHDTRRRPRNDARARHSVHESRANRHCHVHSHPIAVPRGEALNCGTAREGESVEGTPLLRLGGGRLPTYALGPVGVHEHTEMEESRWT